MKRTLLLLLVSTHSYLSSAQVNLVSDINSGTNSSIPDNFFEYDNRLFFTANDAINGTEMWTYDGTSSTMLIDINPGASSSVNYSDFIEFNGNLYFNGYESAFGNELYEYDGTNTPNRITDICAGGCNSIIGDLTEFNGKLYFRANGPGNDSELYVYDGINVSLVADINTTGSSYPYSLIVFNNKLVFRANDGTNGIELFEYDGTNPPTLVADINPGAAFNSFPSYLTIFNGELYFSATEASTGKELWKYDGINAPTMVADAVSGTGSMEPKHLFEFNGQLYFSGTDSNNGRELWTYDGTNTPNMFAELNPSAQLGGGSDPRYFVEFNGNMVFRATDSIHGRELWSFDGINPPTILADINSGTNGSSSDWNLNTRKNIVAYNGKLIFAADTPTVGEEIYEFECLTDFTISQNGTILSANQSNASYQWIDCSNNSIIGGETNQTYSPTVNGNYACIITENVCSDTSACATVNTIGIDELQIDLPVIYPNPAHDALFIQTDETILKVSIYNLLGELIKEEQTSKLSITDLTTGLYVINIETTGSISQQRFVKN